MDDIVGVAVLECVNHLFDDSRRQSIAELTELLQYLEQFSLGRVLKHQVDSVLVIKVVIQLEDVRMFELGLDFYFAL